MASIICKTFDINFVFEEIVKFMSFIARIKSNLMKFLSFKFKNRNHMRPLRRTEILTNHAIFY